MDPKYNIYKFSLSPDYEGPVEATLVHYPSASKTEKACLYIHGYADYFFQDHLRAWFTDRGVDFYALDLRKHGRSLMPHQKPCYVRDLREYYEEIDQSIQQILKTGASSVCLLGHSTGALIASLYAKEGQYRSALDYLILNSPFLDFRAKAWERYTIRFAAALSRVFPNLILPYPTKGIYGQTLHQDYGGEWDYKLEWKPVFGFNLFGAWMRAIGQGQRRLQRGLDLQLPILLLRSDKFYLPNTLEPEAWNADIVLDVTSMQRYAHCIGAQVEEKVIVDAIHDVFLSKQTVRELAFKEMEYWLHTFING